SRAILNVRADGEFTAGHGAGNRDRDVVRKCCARQRQRCTECQADEPERFHEGSSRVYALGVRTWPGSKKAAIVGSFYREVIGNFRANARSACSISPRRSLKASAWNALAAPSAFQIGRADLRPFQEFVAGSSQRDQAIDHDIAAMSELERVIGVLLDDQDGEAVLPVQRADRLENLPRDQRREAKRRLVQ